MDYIGFFSGGGIKGLAYIGCIKALEERGLFCKRCAGVSIGGIFGCLLMAGLNITDLLKIAYNNDFTNFFTKNNFLDTVKKLGKSSSKKLEHYLDEILSKKGINTFNDLYYNGDYKLKVVGTNLKKMKKIVFPDDLRKYNIDINNFKISKALIMTSSMPFLFEPLRLNNQIILDGGLIDNIPRVEFNDSLPKIYFTFKDHLNLDGFVIKINLPKINSTDFNLDIKTKQEIIKCGYMAGKNFLNRCFI